MSSAMRKALVSLALVALVLGGGSLACGAAPYVPTSYEVYNHPGLNYNVSYPSEWEVLEETVTGAVYVGHEELQVSVYAGVEALAPNSSFEDYVSDGKSELMQYGFTIIGEGPITAGNKSGYELLVSISSKSSSLKARGVYFLLEGVVYIITCTAAEDEFGRYEEVFDTIINAFTFEPT